MSKTVKSYNFLNVKQLFNTSIDDLLKFLRDNNVEIFYIPRLSGPGRARTAPVLYIKANKFIDDHIRAKNLFETIKGNKPVKPSWKKYEPFKEQNNNILNNLFDFSK